LSALLRPRVSLVIACHDYGRYLGVALDSLLSQDLQDLEIIAFDDASKDETSDVLRARGADTRLRVIRNDERHGHIRCNNEGLALAQGDFVGIFDADDFLTRSDALRRQVAIFDADPNVGFVYSAHMLVDDNGRPFRTFRPWPEDYVRDGLDEFAHLIHACYVQHSGTLVRRAFHRPSPVYDAELPHSGDWDIWLRIAARHRVGYIADTLLAYRIHSSQMSQRRIAPAVATTNLLRTIDNAFAALDAEGVARVGHLRSSARVSALLHQSRTDRSNGRARRSWSALLDAVRRAPDLLVRRELYWALARLVVLTVVGPRRYTRIVSVRDRVAGGKAPVA
jgi:glycosyltransferase involved in cell wall biosynthesis